MKLRYSQLLGIAAVSLLFIAMPSYAEEAVLELNPAQTQVNFTLGDVLHTVHGSFKLKSGIVKFETRSGHAQGLIVIDATSGDSGNSMRDHKMNKDILESASYPEITFAPQQVEGQVMPEGDFKVQVSGTFTLHGGNHLLTLAIQAHVVGNQLAADSNFTVPYESWGLKNPSTLFLRVNNSVDIGIHAVGQLKLSSNPH